ncbi:MAG: hypothetical protein K2J79_10985 [Ruminiclostridium sp.]|nr:hypothetical protein [Ruminiclostridium sp.]
MVFAVAAVIVVTYISEGRKEQVLRKPIIYLYADKALEVSVKLDFDGITCTYPEYKEDGWNVTAYPDGTLIDSKGNEYGYLFWEGVSKAEFDFSEGFCVKGSDTAEFLRWALLEQGLTPREYNEFIVYWLPLMQDNAYNIISFQGDIYEQIAPLSITPAPDSIKRVFMAYYPSDSEKEIPPQTLTGFDRSGFTVVEWGGTCVSNGK